MKDIITNLTEQFRQRHREARRYVSMLLVLALVTTLFVNWQLHGVGISMTADYHCGYEEHQHTEACYEKVLTCGYEEGEPEDPEASSLPEEADLDPDFGVDVEPEYELQTQTILVPHIHTDACYEEQQELTCFEEEHEHTDDCFDEEGALICGKFEHVHDDSCYTTEDVLVCGKEDGELDEEEVTYEVPVSTRPIVIEPAAPAEDTNEETVHHHTDACYTEELVCTLPEHHHTVECLADEQVDVETPEEWQAAANVTLNGSWPEDLVAVAKSQLGYQESEKNFKLDTEDQATVRGYSRYGAWYGNPYGEWDVMFLSYCLQFAGVPQSAVPQRAGVLALRSDLQGSDILKDAGSSAAKPGDIVLYQTTTTETVALETQYGIAVLNLDGEQQQTASEPQTEERVVTIETVGIVTEASEDGSTLTMISGDVDGKVAEVQLSAAEVTGVIALTEANEAEDAAEDADETDDVVYDELASSDDAFGATVEWVGEEADPYGIALLAADNSHDLNSWITSISFDKYVNGSWVPIGSGSATVDSGTTVRVGLKYTVDTGVLTLKNNTLTYQLPGGMTLPEAQSGNIVDEKADNKVVGHYTIDTSGEATLTFTDRKFIGTDETGGAAFTGTFQFSQKLWADDFANDKTITVEDKYTLTVKAKKPDVNVSKGYTDYWSAFENHPENGTFINHYKVTVETTSGTKDPVILTDTLNTNKDGNSAGDYLKGGTYLTNSFKLCKVDASGKETEISFPLYELKTDGNGNPQVVLAELPALDIGEKYIWYYDVQRNYADFDKMPDGVGTIYNTATVKAGDKEAKADAYYTCKTPRIEKKGQYDSKTGRIQWTITVKTPHSFLGSYMLQGRKITDSLPAGVQIVGDVKVGNTTISAEKFRKDGYTIPADFTGTELTITFETTTRLGGGSVTNTAQIETKSGRTFTASDTENIGQGDWTLSKQLASSSKGLAKWDISAANAAGESGFTLVETLQDAVNEIGQTQPDTHYAYAAELEQALETGLTLTLHNGDTMTYARAKAAGVITVTYYSGANGTGGTVTANYPSTRVRSFTIQVNKADDNPVRRVDVTGIPTHQDRSKVPTGENWTYKNSVSIQGTSKSATAEDTYRSYKSFEKLVAAESNNNESGYLSGNNSFEWNDLSGKNLHYQLVLQTAASDDAEITVTDTLPENTTFKLNTVKIALDDDAFKKVSDKGTTWADAEYEEATRKLTIKIRDYNLDGKTARKIRIVYEVNVEGDPAWNDPSVGQVTYTNSATWGILTETTNTTVTRDVDQVKKTGEQVKDNDGSVTGRIRYRVVINPAREDLSAGQSNAEYIELWDDVSATNSAIVTGDRDSVKLYYYQYDAVNGVTCGEEVPRNMYRILDADKDGWLHMEIPNRAALILVYECDVKDGYAADKYEVSNTVTLSNGSKDSSEKFKYEAKSQATASTGQFLLRKVDSYSGVSLQGAEFTIYKYNAKSGEWTPWTGNGTTADGTVTTDAKGQVRLTVLENETGYLNADVLYKFVETHAPKDYRLDATPHYVLFRKAAQTAQEAFEAAAGVAAGVTSVTDKDGKEIDLKRNVQVGSVAQTTTAEYTNVYSNLTISKLWLDQDTKQPIDPAAENITVNVYRYTTDPNQKEWFATVTLDANNKWSYSWSGNKLDLDDGHGHDYHYLVEEETTGNWNVYIDNNDVQTGEITIQNRVYTGVELPSTGGMGTAPFAVLGGLTAAGAALLLVRRRKKDLPVQEKESEE